MELKVRKIVGEGIYGERQLLSAGDDFFLVSDLQLG